jgi:hypothetical protein
VATNEDISKERTITLGQRLYEGAKSVVESLPGGPIAVFLFNQVVGDPSRERLERWIMDLAEQLERNKDVDVDKLGKDPLFQTVLRRAAWAAINDHQKVKLDALRNAVLNSANSIDLNENRQLMFLKLIDRMTELHLRVLIFLSDPKKPLREMGVDDTKGTKGGSLRGYLLKYFSIPETDPHDLKVVLRDLQASWLVPEDVYGENTERKLYSSHVTPVGNQLVKFITNPLPEASFEGSQP